MRIRNQVWLVMVGLLGAVTVGFTLFLYQAQSQALDAGLDQELQTAAWMAKELLPPGYHDGITGPASVSPAEYTRIVDQFNRICTEAHLEYLWSLMVLDGKVVFTSATSPSKDITQNDQAKFLEVHSNPELYTKAFETMQPQYQLNADKWGRIRAVLLPFRDSHGRPYLIGASRSLQAVDAQLRATLVSSLLASGLILLAGLGLCWALARSLAHPVEAITQAAVDIAAGHLSRTVQVKGARELEQLGGSINTMSRSIEARLRELHESRQLFQTLAQVSPVGIFRTDAAGACVYVNEQWVEIVGVPARQALGAQWSHSVHPDDQPRVARAWAEYVNGGQATFQLESRFQRPDGEVTWVLAQSLAERGPADLVLGHVGTLTNITDRKHAEQMIQTQNEQLQAQNEELLAQGQALEETAAEMRQLNLELEQRVAGRTQELRLANAALQRAARLKDEFLANMSHELRTPLTGILGLTEALEMGIYDAPAQKQLRPLHLIYESGEHLLALINDILDVSKIEYGKVELQVALVSITDICETSLLFVKQLALKKNLRLSISCQVGADSLRADPRRLKQILVNLLCNAVKFTPPGGAAGLEVSGEADKKLIHFTIWDTGIGIAPENLSQLFQPFVQLDNRLAREYDGAGLGLALVMGLAELHGGSVSVESELGHGSRFTVTLPWVAAGSGAPLAQTLSAQPLPWLAVAPSAEPASEPKLSDSPSAATHSGPIVLLADDNDTVLTTLGDFLEAQDFQIRLAHTGVEALELANAITPDLVLMDIQMPVMDGLEAIRRLRAHGQLTTVPIIALTALAMPGDRERCLAAGADAYLSKPVSLSELGQTIQHLLATTA